jgi:two-component system OmpR family response regulator
VGSLCAVLPPEIIRNASLRWRISVKELLGGSNVNLEIRRRFSALMKTIAFVEDDEILRENFAELLRTDGFSVVTFGTADEALRGIGASMPDLALLDIGLGQDADAGFALCLELRKRSQVLPIVFFTSHDSDFDKISGLRLGADDYITKDASLEYLSVRIKALLRRIAVLSAGPSRPGNTMATGDLSLDLDELHASWKGASIALMTLTQFWMLHSLAEHPGHVKTHDQLMRAARIRVEPNTVAAHMKSIRQRFLQIDPGFACIHTERGIGYRWVTADASAATGGGQHGK